MSYILDALRRADSERERGAVPGIHALAVPAPSADELARRTPWPWVVAALVLVLLLVLAGWLWSREAPAPTAPASLPVAATREPLPVAPPAPPPVATPPAVALPAPIERRPTSSEAVAERKPGAPAGGASAAGAAQRVPARHELPDDIRRQLPPVSVSGSMFSPDPASRFLVINGQVVHEKNEVGPDHVLVQIKLRAAVLRFRGTLYEITF